MTRTVLLRLLDEAFDHRSWHGTNLRGSIRGLTVEAASWRPKAGRRQAVADMPEQALHARGRGPFDNLSLVTGIAAHDLYHAGQIQLLKRLRRR